jgi:hypothetical protein
MRRGKSRGVMDKIKYCNICGEKITDKLELPFESVVGMAEHYTQCVSICRKCGFIFTSNPFTSEQLENRYKNFSKFEFDSEDYILSETEDYKTRSIRQKQFIERVVGKNQIKSILEIGAASGYNLSLYNDCDVYGIEPSENNCKSAKANYGVDMYCGMFDEFMGEKFNKTYDLIFLSHVLEHIVNPCDFIKECSVLNNRYVFIEVPTFDYKFVDEPYGMFAEEHVNQFTLEALNNLMQVCGYELLNADMIMGLEQSLPAGWPAISSIWEKKENIKVFHTVRSSENILDEYLEASKKEMEEINSIIDNIPNDTKLAIWGTGHHASMLLANTRLAEKNVVRVYDSDIRKKSIEFHGVKIRPFCAEDIVNGEVDSIILATYTAQRSLVSILEKYKKMVNVITLYDI